MNTSSLQSMEPPDPFKRFPCIFGLRFIIRSSQEPSWIDFRPIQLMRDIAPMISSRRMSTWPSLETLPSRALPPDECCFGTSPSKAAKSRPHRNMSMGVAKASIAMAVSGPTSGIVLSRRDISDCSDSFLSFNVFASIRVVSSKIEASSSSHSSRTRASRPLSVCCRNTAIFFI